MKQTGIARGESEAASDLGTTTLDEIRAETEPGTCRPEFLKAELLREAGEAGFAPAGIAPASPAETSAAYRDWLAAGHHGEMGYMARDPDRRASPRIGWPQCGSILVVALNHRVWDPDPSAQSWDTGRIARYAVGRDYHDLIRDRLLALLDRVRSGADPGLEGRAYVDAGPLLERDLARRAGLGWFGKNTMLLNRAEGSYFFLGALLINRELPSDTETSAHCGTCRRCLDVCPTGAFVSPYVLDARRCISYLTIELKGPIPRELRPLVGNWIFGCDLCQEVCPWNRKSLRSLETAFRPSHGLEAPDLIELLALDEPSFRSRFDGSPILRARRRGFLRNICVALGNSGDARAVPALVRALDDPEPLVRGHAVWALARLDPQRAREEIGVRLGGEPDRFVRDEMHAVG